MSYSAFRPGLQAVTARPLRRLGREIPVGSIVQIQRIHYGMNSTIEIIVRILMDIDQHFAFVVDPEDIRVLEKEVNSHRKFTTLPRPGSPLAQLANIAGISV